MVGQRKKESFRSLKDKIIQRIESWSSSVLSQGRRKFLLNQCFKRSPLMRCTVSYCLRRFVLSWRDFLLVTGGVKAKGRKGSIGVSGNICAK